MTKQRIWLLTAVVFSLATYVSFEVGKRVGAARAYDWFVIETERSNEEIAFGRYLSNRDVAKNIKLGNAARAKCGADLAASVDFDTVKECLDKPSCNPDVVSKVASLAPELNASPDERPFDYIATKRGRKECSNQ